MEILAANHKNHLQKIRDHETQLIKGLKAWKLDLLKEVELSPPNIGLSPLCVIVKTSPAFFMFVFLSPFTPD